MLLAFRVELAEAAQRSRRHLGIAELAEGAQALVLTLARFEDAVANRGGRFEYGEHGRHGWSPYKSNADIYREMAVHTAKNTPSGDPDLWHYR